jgi:hypothetical protein
MADYEKILRTAAEIRDRLDQLMEEIREARGTAAPEGTRSLLNRSLERGDGTTTGAGLSSLILPPSREVDTIVGGEETNDYPDCCAVGDDQGFFCSGTLIAPNVVVTARHCTQPTRVFLKGSHVSRPADGEIRGVSARHSHENADLQVLILAEPSTVAPRHVAQQGEVRGTECLVVGFGTFDLDGKLGYGRKRMVKVPIKCLACDDTQAQKAYGCRPNEMVAGHRGLRKDTCSGDSGGPLYIGSSLGGWNLMGATSRGIKGGDTVCGDGGVYVRIDRYLPWIVEKTGIQIEGPLD